MKNIKIHSISGIDTYKVRHPVLRPGRPIKDCAFKGDNYPTTLHLGLFVEQALIGVVSFIKNNHPLIPKTNQIQLRGMAILNNYQGKGYGKLIVKKGETLIAKRQTNIIWLNARENAEQFYKKMGFKKIGIPFNIPLIGKHYTMFKNIEIKK